MLDRPSILTAISLLPAIIALVGLGVSPAVVTDGDEELLYLIHAWFGLSAILAGCRYAGPRRVHPRILGLVPAGAIMAGLAGLLLGVGVGSSQDGAARVIAIVLVLAVFVGLALAEGAAIVAIIAGTRIRGRFGRVLRVVGFGGGGLTVILMMLTTMQPLEEPFSWTLRHTGEALAMVALPTFWTVLAVVTLDRLDAMPEFGGRIDRPRVAYTCPRCGRPQSQAGARGCRRCGLDVRIELL